jgi:hypothetical protein
MQQGIFKCISIQEGMYRPCNFGILSVAESSSRRPRLENMHHRTWWNREILFCIAVQSSLLKEPRVDIRSGHTKAVRLQCFALIAPASHISSVICAFFGMLQFKGCYPAGTQQRCISIS